MTALLLCLAGLAVLVLSAEVLVRAAVRLATALGIAPIVVGLTVVSVGTSAPELAVGIDAALRGVPDLAVGNIAGTNIVNILLILGLSAALSPLVLDRRTLRFDLPAMVLSALALLAASWDGHLSRIDGAALLAGAAGYTWLVLRTARAPDRDAAAPPVDRPAAGRNLLVLVLSIAAVIWGANLLVAGATDLARRFGISEAVIGLTIVAIGTSAPELVTTMVSTLRGNRDVAIGNLIGSSAYNILLILGLTVIVPAGGIPVSRELAMIDIPLMTLVALACVPVFLTGGRIARPEGTLAVLAYAGYLGWLVLART